MVEEPAHSLYDAAARLGVPVFIFQEGPDVLTAQAFGEMARLTKGAHLKFAAGSARELAELLRAVGAFAVGG
jgi:hypothetical protein